MIVTLNLWTNFIKWILIYLAFLQTFSVFYVILTNKIAFDLKSHYYVQPGNFLNRGEAEGNIQ